MMRLPVGVEPRTWRAFKHQFGGLIQWTLTFFAASFLVLTVIAQFDNTPPIRFINSDKEVTTAEDGKSFFVTRETCVDRQVAAEALPRLVGVGSNILIPLPQKPLSAVPGCHVYKVLVLIPEEVPPGLYEYRLTYRFVMNPFKTLDINAAAVRVTVTK